ncbi:YHYH domain-containing protein [Cupriavidus pauculus]|uniref:YHYH domain-containing protein n=1 Tax=Cupriavidus pauculus TaxID=82633 RepID=A0A2N5C3K3_9BURK|nr:YHYH domain-containing protein [Cupriavidus pauculus]PLP96809.1 YHYH domain-containing protein [Cupriavidus pauculus]
MCEQFALRRHLTTSASLVTVCFASLIWASVAHAHGGGLDADGCHTNRKTGEYHCHRGGARVSSGVERPQNAVGARSANSFVSTRSLPGPTCYTGPRGGTYTITASGRKNYGGC